MNKIKFILLFLALIIVTTAVGCSQKEKSSESDSANKKTASQAELNLPEGTSAAINSANPSTNENQNTPQSITVISKSDSTITQAEKKKVLDDLSVEIDSLINEVNNDNSSEGKLE